MQLRNNSKKKEWYFFIKKTRVAIVLSLLIVILGYLSIKLIPQEIYPDTSSPMVYVTASYPGASPDVMESSVANILEAGLTGLENMEYMESECYDEGYSLTIYFKAGSNKDVNLLNVKNQLQEIDFQLPPEVQRNGVSAVTTSGDKGSIILNLSAKNDNWEQLDLANYAKTNVVDKLKMVDGVADCVLSGIGDYSMRIWLDPQKMAALGVTVSEVKYALNQQNQNYVVGTLGTPPLPVTQDVQMLIKADNLLSSPEQFANVVIKSDSVHGQVTIADIARIELGASNYNSYALVGEKATALISVTPTADANMVEVSAALNKKLEQINRWLPRGLELNIVYDSSIYMKEAINEVVSTIFVTVAIVILVILLFLGDIAATLVPCVTIPISLIGAFGVLYMFNMSINMLTLFALILAVSVVVDDAIVVVENVNRHIQDGNSPKRATQLTMEEVGVTLVTMALVLMTVFFPICFIPGFTGILYKQFAVFLSASIIISAICALTLSPAMTSVMLQRNSNQEKFENGQLGLWSKIYFAFNQIFKKLNNIYTDYVKLVVYSPKITITAYLCIVFLLVFTFQAIPKAFVPDEDQGLIMAKVYIENTSTVERSKNVVQEITKRIKDVEGINFDKLLVMGNDSGARIWIQLDEWGERVLNPLERLERKLNKRQPGLLNTDIQKEVVERTKNMEDVFVSVNLPQSLGSSGSGLELNLVATNDYTLEQISKYADDLIKQLKEDYRFSYLYNTYYGSVPVYVMQIDYKKAIALRIDISELTDTLATYIGSSHVTDFYKNGKNYNVMMQADGEFRRHKSDLGKISVRGGSGKMIPVETVVSLKEVSSSSVISRLNQGRSIKIVGQNSEEATLSDAMKALEEQAEKILPPGITYEWTGSSLQALESTNQTIYIVALALLFIYFFLVALYNSWSIPVIILIVTPVSILGALVFLLMLGKPFDLYSQIGLITLIGLSAKQSILFLEFAIAQKEEGNMTIQNASIFAATMRFRAILMTEMSFLIGVIPMLFATGANANSRISLAATVFGGMLTTVSVGAVLTPGFYAIVQTWLDKMPKQIEEDYYDEADYGNEYNQTFI